MVQECGEDLEETHISANGSKGRLTGMAYTLG